MIKKCPDIVKPEVDNTAIECCDIRPSNCVPLSSPIPYIGILKGDTSTQAFINLSQKLQTVQQKVDKTFYYYVNISQTGTDSPTIFLVENSFNVVFTYSYSAIGVYLITATSPIFDLDKTFVICPSRKSQSYSVEWEVLSTTQIQLKTYDNTSTLTNGLLDRNPLQIKTPRTI